MRFLFVEKVTAVREDLIEGSRSFRMDDPMQYRPLRGDPEVAPGAVSEAIGQLASWLCLARNDFAARPVFLFADKIEIMGTVPVGATVQLSANLHEMDDESLRFSGEARVGGRVVQKIQQCSGYFMPLGELEDPDQAKDRFVALTTGGLQYDGMGGQPFAFDALAGDTVELVPKTMIRVEKHFRPDEPFYADHFPRFPVTPIVMLNEMVGAATTRMLGLSDGRRLAARCISGIKIRSFVKPGERCETIVRSAPALAGNAVATTAEIHKDGRCILRGSYEYEIRE